VSAFEHHIFICTNRREPGNPRGCCNADGTEALRNAFKNEVKARGLGATVRANSAGCLDQCELGPTVVIYPRGIWYGGVTVADVPRILEETVRNGKILDDLLISDHLLNNRPAAQQVKAAREAAAGVVPSPPATFSLDLSPPKSS
jgi:(2Fe-2S) ferredoxin